MGNAEIRLYLENAKAEIDKALAGLPASEVVGPPQTYPNLRTDKTIVKPASLPLPAAGTSVVDPVFGTKIWRVTGEGGWGTLSAPNMCQVSADDKLFLALAENGGHKIFEVDFAQNGPFRLIRGGVFSVEPTFSHVRPDVLYYADHATHQIRESNARTGVNTILFDVQQDVGPLYADDAHNQYMSAVYSSRSTPERLVCAYGKTQELHPYVTVLDVGTTKRITLDVTNSKVKVNGGAWTPLYNYDGTLANLHYGIHSVSIDKSGKWVRVDVSGNAQHVFVNVDTLKVYQWGINAYQYTWYGHYTWGYESIVRAICGPGDLGEYQWLFSDFHTPPAPPTFRKLIAKTNVNDQQYDAHPNWNHAVPDRLVPLLDATERPSWQTAPWQPYDDEIVMVSTETPAAAEVYRVCHHRSQENGSFYDAPRPQAFHSGRAALFTSNWLKAIPNRDLFLVQF